MEQDTSDNLDSELVSFGLTGSVGDLLSLQNGSGGGLEAGATSEAASNHLSHGVLEELASIQEELDRFGSASSQANFVEGIMNPIITTTSSEDTNNLLNTEASSNSSNLTNQPITSSLTSDSLKTEVRPTVRVVKRPVTSVSSASTGQVYSKVRIGEAGQPFRIIGSSQGNIVSLGGQQIRLVNSIGGGNLKTIVPSDNSGIGQTINIVNKDGSISSVQTGLKLATSGQLVQASGGGSTVKIASKPQQIRILPNQQPQTFKIVNPDGSLSEVSSIRPKVVSSVESSPSKKLATYTLKSPQKMQLLKPESGQVLKTSDGRIINLQQGMKKLVLPSNSSLSSSPTKVVFRDSQGKTLNGSIVVRGGDQLGGGQNIVLKHPTEPPASEETSSTTFQKQASIGGGQLIRLTPEIASNIASNSDNKVQFVRVVGGGRMLSSAPGGQTIQIKGGQPFINNVQGVRSVLPTNGKVEEEEDVKVDIKSQIVESYAKEKPKPVTNIEPQGVRPRKPCNCTKSQCLKLYCDCFANGEFCFNCNCNNCLNNLQNEEERQRSIKQCLDRNPNAFKPKIGKNSVEGERRHNKGCNCKRSGCLKNYCECYEAKIPCTVNCKCVGCKNVDTETGSKVLCSPVKLHSSSDNTSQSQALNMSEKWFKPSSSLKSKLLQANTPLDTSDKGGSKQPFSFVTQEVVEATCQCLLAQAEEGEKNCNTELETEKKVLEEFGRCLAQIIEFSGKNKKISTATGHL